MKTPAEIQESINRGTLIAFEQFNTVESAAVADLIRVYQEAADELADIIKNSAGRMGKIDLSVLQVLLAEIRQRIDDVNAQANQAIIVNIKNSATLGTAAMLGVASEASMISAATAASEYVLNLHRAGGLGLSERLWQINRGAADVVSRAVQSAIVTGEGGYEAAWDLVARNAQDALLTSPDNALFKAARVMRTEMSRAYNAAYVKSTQDIPGLIGYKFNLSKMHTVKDICDSLANADKYGLGAGVYPIAEIPAMPVHPHGRSFLTLEI